MTRRDPDRPSLHTLRGAWRRGGSPVDLGEWLEQHASEPSATGQWWWMATGAAAAVVACALGLRFAVVPEFPAEPVPVVVREGRGGESTSAAPERTPTPPTTPTTPIPPALPPVRLLAARPAGLDNAELPLRPPVMSRPPAPSFGVRLAPALTLPSLPGLSASFGE